jgi:hypothetical protein
MLSRKVKLSIDRVASGGAADRKGGSSRDLDRTWKMERQVRVKQ